MAGQRQRGLDPQCLRDVDHLRQRKGASRIALIPTDVLAALNQGLLPTVNLSEYLAIDLAGLTTAVAQHVGLDASAPRITDTLAVLSALKPMKRHLHIARALYDETAVHFQRDAVAQRLACHPSDVARCWAAQWLMFSGLPLADQFTAVRRFAADPHFGVREIAWMAMRDDTIAQLDHAMALLQPWVHDPHDNIRRFACELTRPRGVWCAQIEALKTEPWRALRLLEPLRADPSRYVQNSLANWLNDASKSQPAWVVQVTERWRHESPLPATEYIIKRASRTLG